MSPVEFLRHIQAALERYREVWPLSGELHPRLLEQISNEEHVGSRTNFRGHVTASCVVLDANQSRILLIRHLGTGLWLVPGGHYEGEAHLKKTATRELVEETGISSAILDEKYTQSADCPIDIDTHVIPANPKKSEPEHYHHDFRYAFSCRALAEVNLDIKEVGAYRWVVLADVPISAGLQRVIRRIEQCKRPPGGEQLDD